MPGFRVPTHVHLARGAVERLPAILDAMGSRRVLLVTDPGLESTPWPDVVRSALHHGSIDAIGWQAVHPNPRTTDAEAAAGQARQDRVDAVVGLGGGSVLDAAKAAAMLATNPGPAESYVGKNRFRETPLPFVAIPTTCGTGSEVTWVSVLSHEVSRRKISVKGERMFPNAALVDPDLLSSLPTPMVAATGLDALTHAVEATTGKAANPVSDALAEKAVGLIFRFLERAVADIGGDGEARFEVMRASTIAGLAFGNADVGGVHCLSESLGGLYDVPHGLANALLLAPVLRSHRPFVDADLARLERCLSPAALDGDQSATETAEAFLARLDRLVEALGLPSFGSFGIARGDHDQIARLAVENGSNPSNPRPMRAEDYLAVLASVTA